MDRFRGMKGTWKSVAIEGISGEDLMNGVIAFEELDPTEFSVESSSSKKKKSKGPKPAAAAAAAVAKPNKRSAESTAESTDGSPKKKRKKKKTKKTVTVENGVDEQSEKKTKKLDMSKWIDLSVSQSALKALRSMDMEEPTPIQRECIPIAIRETCDIVGAAPTGSGKTLAFGIPLVHQIQNDKALEQLKTHQKDDSPIKGARALILAPTRELVIQICKHIHAVSEFEEPFVRICPIVGGMSSHKQERLIMGRKSVGTPEILVATPGRLWELMQSKEELRSRIISVKYLVVDEADRMVEKGHFEEVKQIVALLEARRRTFVFSATLTFANSLPEGASVAQRKDGSQSKVAALIETLGMKTGQNTRVVDMAAIDIEAEASTSVKQNKKAVIAGTGIPDRLTHYIINCSTDEKDAYLYYYLSENSGKTIVFCNSISCVKRLVSVLRTLRLAAIPLHANMIQKNRLKNLDRFAGDKQESTEPRQILVATDVAARGLDVSAIAHVIHYQVPRTGELYIHRSGRTARAGLTGTTLLLCDPKERAFYLQKVGTALQSSDTKKIDQFATHYPVVMSVFERMKRLVSLALQCEALEHSIKKEASDENWMTKAAREAELIDSDLEEEERAMGKNQDRRNASAAKKAQLLSLSRQLDQRLKQAGLPIAKKNII